MALSEIAKTVICEALSPLSPSICVPMQQAVPQDTPSVPRQIASYCEWRMLPCLWGQCRFVVLEHCCWCPQFLSLLSRLLLMGMPWSTWLLTWRAEYVSTRHMQHTEWLHESMRILQFQSHVLPPHFPFSSGLGYLRWVAKLSCSLIWGYWGKSWNYGEEKCAYCI